MKNMQECFNTVYKHAQKQQKQAGIKTAVFPVVKGKYKDGENKCFIGCLLTDMAYIPYIEFKGTTDKRVIDALIQSNVDVFNISPMFFSRLQCIHDMHQPIFWSVLLKKLASDFNLTI